MRGLAGDGSVRLFPLSVRWFRSKCINHHASWTWFRFDVCLRIFVFNRLSGLSDSVCESRDPLTVYSMHRMQYRRKRHCRVLESRDRVCRIIQIINHVSSRSARRRATQYTTTYSCMYRSFTVAITTYKTKLQHTSDSCRPIRLKRAVSPCAVDNCCPRGLKTVALPP